MAVTDDAEDPMVSTAWLAERLGDPAVKPLDATWWFPHEARDPRAEFEAAHIPGAAFFDIDAVADPATPLPHMLPTPEAFARAVEALGVGDGVTAVIYEAGAPRAAARAWWSFRAFGHDSVKVLDGGLPKWRAEGRPLESGSASPPASVRFTPCPRPELVRAADQVRTAIDGGGQIADARPAPRFRGEAPEPRAGLKGGHMPGAKSLPASAFFDGDGLLLPKPDLEKLFENGCIDPTRPLIATCGSGLTACTIVLASARLGHWDTAVYDGSWAEWGALDGAPVAGPA